MSQMPPHYPQLHPSKRILMGPGPSDVPPRVLQAMSTPLLGHLDPEFLTLMDRNQEMLRYVFGTTNRLTLPISATGSAGMEASIVNLVEPGDRFLACVNGVFGARMREVASRAGAQVHVLEKPWGQVFTEDEVKMALAQIKPKVVGLVHAETSTGTLQPMDQIGPMIYESGALLLLDCVTSLGGVRVDLDAWQVASAYSGTQKCLSCPPGLAPLSFSERAEQVLAERKTPVQSWYLDLSMVQSYWGQERTYHHTAPISMNFALYEALRVVCEEGLTVRHERHWELHGRLKEGLAALGIEYAADPNHLCPMLNAVHVPKGVDDLTVRQFLLQEFGIEIGGGLSEFKGKVWRIGLMGESARVENVALVLAALKEALKYAG